MPIPADDSDLLQAWLDSHREDTHTAIVARVDSYNSATQRATVTPVVRTPLKDGTYEEPLTLSDVPIGIVRGGGFFMHIPLAVGDHVLLVFSQLSLSEWTETGQRSSPKNVRRHGPSSCYGIPCAAPANDVIADASATDLTIGKDGTDSLITVDAAFVKLGKGATDFAALASKVDTAISNVVTWANAHVHTGVTTGPGSTGTVGTPLTGQASVAATIVKAK